MKYNKEKIKECAAWVEEHGWYEDTPIGATQREFCKAMRITEDTLKKWEKKTDFSEAITRAKLSFRRKCINTAVNALLKRVEGYDVPLTSEDAIKDSSGRLVTKSASRKMKHIPPDVDAIKFVLTNLDPEHWKNKQDTTADLNVDMDAAPVIMFSDNPKPEVAAGEFTETRTEP